MKRLVALLMALCLCVGFCACAAKAPAEEANNTPAEQPTEAPTETVPPEISMVINDHSADTTTNIKMFPADRDYSQDTAYAHYYVTSAKETEMIRIKLENQWGSDEKVKREFAVESDALLEVETNKWLTFSFSISASNLYFYRVTMYYGETDQVLATKTIYTPYEKPFYGESDFSDEPPAFHSINVLTEEEQAFFDKCEYAVVSYAKARQFSGVSMITGWQGSTHLYLYVEFKTAKGYKHAVFAIHNNNLQDYSAGEDYWHLIPDGEGTGESNVLQDYYYVESALSKAIAK